MLILASSRVAKPDVWDSIANWMGLQGMSGTGGGGHTRVPSRRGKYLQWDAKE